MPRQLTSIVSIVFVHGLQGHPEKTWTNVYDPGAPQSSAWRRLFRRRLKLKPPTAGTVFWPYDLLSRHKDFTTSRILTWGYDTRVVREIFGGGDSQNISQHGNNLMVMLQQQRKDAVRLITTAPTQHRYLHKVPTSANYSS